MVDSLKVKTILDEKVLGDLANPCMKCGSVQCAICYDDLKPFLPAYRCVPLAEQLRVIADAIKCENDACGKEKPVVCICPNCMAKDELLALVAEIEGKKDCKTNPIDILMRDSIPTDVTYKPYDGKSLEGAGTKTKNEQKK